MQRTFIGRTKQSDLRGWAISNDKQLSALRTPRAVDGLAGHGVRKEGHAASGGPSVVLRRQKRSR